jgi:hypothetical protein
VDDFGRYPLLKLVFEVTTGRKCPSSSRLVEMHLFLRYYKASLDLFGLFGLQNLSAYLSPLSQVLTKQTPATFVLFSPTVVSKDHAMIPSGTYHVAESEPHHSETSNDYVQRSCSSPHCTGRHF